MKEIKCILFDMDGVMIDTEPQYDILWRHLGNKYNVGIPNFEMVIKGTTLDNILAKYFSHLSEEEVGNLLKYHNEFEKNMSFDEIPGALNFLEEAKKHGIKAGLVTSSDEEKLEAVNRRQHFDILFDTIVSAGLITKSKPDPEGYLLAAEKLNAEPENCIVFEDSFAGIQAGKSAGMTVIGLYTTHSKEAIEEKTAIAIPNFMGLTLDKLKGLTK